MRGPIINLSHSP